MYLISIYIRIDLGLNAEQNAEKENRFKAVAVSNMMQLQDRPSVKNNKIKRNTHWAVSVFEQWRSFRNSMTAAKIQELHLYLMPQC